MMEFYDTNSAPTATFAKKNRSSNDQTSGGSHNSSFITSRPSTNFGYASGGDGVAVFSALYQGDDNGFICSVFNRKFCDPFTTAAKDESKTFDNNQNIFGDIDGAIGNSEMEDISFCERTTEHERLQNVCLMEQQQQLQHSANGKAAFSASVADTARPQAPTNSNSNMFDDVMASLNKELQQVSFEEQIKIHEEIHGVYDVDKDRRLGNMSPQASNTIEELRVDHSINYSTDIDMEIFLNDLHKELQKACTQIELASSYMRACEIAPTKYGPLSTVSPSAGVTGGKNYYMKFLQTSNYDTKKTSTRIILNFHYKEILFGPNKLSKDITLDDLSDDDMMILKSGHTMFLPGCDMAGRRVMIHNSRLVNRSKWISHMRVNWYIRMTALQDDDTSFQKGLVYICDEIGGPSIDRAHLQRIRKWTPMYMGLPGQIVSCHYCVQNTTIKPWIEFILRITTKDFRLRLRFHFGGHMECHYKLLSFGIPEELMLSDHEGNLRQEYVDFWIQTQKGFEQKWILQKQQLHEQRQPQLLQQEASSSPLPPPPPPAVVVAAAVNSSTIDQMASSSPPNNLSSENDNSDVNEIVPTDKDILLGRNQRRHPGNVRLSQLVEDYYEMYQAASMIDKTMLSWKIVRIIQDDEGRRFLERTSTSNDDDDATTGKWKVMSDESARYKVAYGFRTQSKLMKRRRKKTNGVN